MKFLKFAVPLALALSFSAHAAIQSIYSIDASVNFDGHQANAIVNALSATGFTPRQDGYVSVSKITVEARSNSKDFLEPNDPCYQKPQYTLTYVYGLAADTLSGKTVTLNLAQKCTGTENDKAAAIYNAIQALGPDGDAAMGGQFGVEVSDLGCFHAYKTGALQCSITIPKSVRLK